MLEIVVLTEVLLLVEDVDTEVLWLLDTLVEEVEILVEILVLILVDRLTEVLDVEILDEVEVL